MTQGLSHSKRQVAQRCLRQYQAKYEFGLEPDSDAAALTRGKAVHLVVQGIWRGEPVLENIEILDAIQDEYSRVAWQALMYAYQEYWSENPIDTIAIEKQWQIPMVNPDTGGTSQTWHHEGVFDGLTANQIVELKTVSESIAPDARYWLRLRVDPQISLYVYAARKLGYTVEHVLYDVVRSVGLTPSQVPLLDDEGRKIVLNDSGERMFKKDGSPYQSTSAGGTLQSRPETAQEYFLRVSADIAERPEWYFARREVPILSDELEAFEADVWQYGRVLAECRRRGYFPRSVSRQNCDSCFIANHCLQSIPIRADEIPAGCRRRVEDDATADAV